MKRNVSLPRLVLALPLLALGACSTTGATPEPTAADIVHRHVRETGIDRLVADTSSMHTQGTMELASFGLKGDLNAYNAKPDRFLLRTTMGPAGMTEVGYDGEIGWMSNPMLGTSLLEGAELFAVQMQADYNAQLMDPGDYEVMEIEGREEFAGRDCYRLRLVYKAPDDPELAEQTLKTRTTTNWFDVETGLMLGQQGTQSSPQGEVEATMTFEEYGERSGYRMPLVLKQDAMGMQVIIRFTEFEPNAVDPSIFEPPDAVQALLEE